MIVDFGDYTLDGERRQLLRSDQPVHLSLKAFELLVTLVSEAPRAISKADLHDRIWPATFVSDSTLASLIAELRSALADEARQPRYLRTVHGFGYAFCSDVAPRGQRSRAPAAWLVCDGYELPLFEGRNVIGRDRGADVRIDQPTVSRRHAVMTIETGMATLEDLRSKNGTSIDSEPLHGSAPVADGAEILLGKVRAHFRSGPMRSSTVTVKK